MGWVRYLWKWVSMASPIPIRATEITVLILTLIMLAIKQIHPLWGNRMDNLAWQLPLGLLIIVFIISIAWSSYNLYNEKNREVSEINQQLEVARKQAYPPITTLMMSPYFKDLDIPLGQFGLASNFLADKTFDHCRIHGTIVVTLLNDVTISLCNFNGNPESTFIVTINQRVDGVLGIRNCTFVSCTFDKVSFIGLQDQINKIKEGFS